MHSPILKLQVLGYFIRLLIFRQDIVYERTIFISLLLCKRVTIIVRLLHTFVNPEIDTLAVVTNTVERDRHCVSASSSEQVKSSSSVADRVQ